MPKYLFEGPDGAYKTTLAVMLHEYLDIPYAKFSQSKSVSEVVQVTRNLARDPNFQDCVIDRVKTVDHLVYGRAIDKLKFSVEEVQKIIEAHRELEQSTDKFILIYVTAHHGELWRRLTARGDESYITKSDLQVIERHYERVLTMYRANGLLLNSIYIDTTRQTSKQAFEQLRRLLNI